MNKRLLGLALIAGVFAPQAAQAHLVATGMGPIYDGVSHFALSPEDSLPVVALALFAGLRGPIHARLLLAVLPLTWLASGLFIAFTGLAPPQLALTVATALILLTVGGLLAANLELSPRLCILPAAALGLVRGAADLAGAPSGASAALSALGMSASVFVGFALAASLTLPLRKFWMIVATRVTGSWLAAAGLLLAGWIIRYGDKVQ